MRRGVLRDCMLLALNHFVAKKDKSEVLRISSHALFFQRTPCCLFNATKPKTQNKLYKPKLGKSLVLFFKI